VSKSLANNNYENEHKGIFGASGAGKTYYAFEVIKKMNIPTIYYNFKNQDMEVIETYKTLSAFNTIKEIEYSLKKYGVVNYLASRKSGNRKKELEMLCSYALDHKNINRIALVIDEAPMLIPEGIREHPILEVARIGRTFGIVLIVIGQRMAGMSNEVISQCEEIYIHKLQQQDYSYLKNKGYMGDMIKDMLEKAPKYSRVKLKGSNMELIECRN
jgi:hypothetical protein